MSFIIFIKFPTDVSASCDYHCCLGYYQSSLLSVLSSSAFCRPPCIFLVSSEGISKQTDALGLFESNERGRGFTCPAALPCQLHLNTKQLQEGILLYFLLQSDGKKSGEMTLCYSTAGSHFTSNLRNERKYI